MPEFNQPVFHNILNALDAENYNISPYSIYEFFDKGDIRKIPNYQRSYSWGEFQVKELLKDILSISEGKNNSWFLGPIFSTKKAFGDNGSELLDGQQRITTILLLLREVSLFKHYLDPAINLNVINPSAINQFDKLHRAAINCLFINKNGHDVPRFITEETSKEFLNDIFLQALNVNSKDQLIKQKKDFEKEGDRKLKIEGSKTAKNLFEAIYTITNWLQKEFITNSALDNFEEKIQHFNNFVNSLLYKCWLIEIPLKTERESINIFESINNRGKQLSLVDKIRFKTLTYLNEGDDNHQEDLDFVKNAWKEIYISLETLSNSRDNEKQSTIISNEDDFFQVYFNATTGKSLTSDSDRMQAFEEAIDINDDGNINDSIRGFLKSIKQILDLLKLVNKPLDEHSWIDDQINLSNNYANFTSSKKIELKNKTSALMHLTKSLITNLSKNSRILIFDLFEKIGTDNSLSSFQYGLYNINKIAFYTEVLSNEKSNITRNKYLKIINDGKTNILYYTNFYAPNSDNFNYLNSISKISPINYIINKENSESKYIIHFTSFLLNYKMLIAGNSIQQLTSELEHLIPEKYLKYYSSLNPCLRNDLIEELQKIKQENILDVNIFDDDWYKNLTNQFNTLTKFDINEENPLKQDESIIEFIGNKWVLEASQNASIGNKDFITKKGRFGDDAIVVIPSNNTPKIGINEYEEFNPKQVIRRSLFLLEIVYKNYSKGIDVL